GGHPSLARQRPPGSRDHLRILPATPLPVRAETTSSGAWRNSCVPAAPLKSLVHGQFVCVPTEPPACSPEKTRRAPLRHISPIGGGHPSLARQRPPGSRDHLRILPATPLPVRAETTSSGAWRNSCVPAAPLKSLVHGQFVCVPTEPPACSPEKTRRAPLRHIS